MKSSDQVYEIRDTDGNLVRIAAQVITTDELGNAYIEYGPLSDLPLGRYTIHPGAISVTVTPDMKPLG